MTTAARECIGEEEAGDREMTQEIAVVVQVRVTWPEPKC